MSAQVRKASWRAIQLILAPLLVVAMLTLGCGRAPSQLGAQKAIDTHRRLQSVSAFNLGVGLNTSTNEFFLFSDFEAARQSPEASNSFLVALDGYELWGPNEGTSGRIDVRVAVPGVDSGASGFATSAGIDVLHRTYDWYTELASANREVPPDKTYALRPAMRLAA